MADILRRFGPSYLATHVLPVAKEKVWRAIVACRTLPADTFIDRFLLHVLPKGFKRIRHYGVLGPAAKAVKLAQARVALAVPPPDPLVVESVAAFMRRIDRYEWARCPHCAQALAVADARNFRERGRRRPSPLDSAEPAGRDERLRAPAAAASTACQTIDSRRHPLTIPIATARTAVQSNEVYPPR